MMEPSATSRWLGPSIASLLLALASFGVSAAESKRVLILNPYVRDIAPFGAVVSAFRSTLARELGEPVDIQEVPLDLARSIGPDGEGPLVAFLEDRIKGRPVDLVAALGGAGVQFAARHRERLFPHTPVLVLGEPRSVPPGFLETNATLVTLKVDLAGMVEDILQMQPQTRNIFVVFGASDVEKFWVAECRREFQRFSDRVAFTYLNELPLDHILERCAALPPHSFILHGLFVMDAAGIYCEKNEALRRLHAAANAPLFGLYASEFGLGSVGGRLFQDSDFGTTAARVGIRILRGEKAASIPPQVVTGAAPVYDWRELQRWGISETGLPAGSVIQFRQPDFWQLYRWPIVGTAAFCLLQAALILGLLANRARRRQGEEEATLMAGISSKFVNLPPGEVDQEILEAERRICTLLRIDLTALWQWSDEASGFFALTHFYSAKDGPQPTEWNDREDFPWIREEMRAGRIVAFSSPAELPLKAARDREVARQLGIKSSLCLPLSVGGGPTIAVLALNTTRTKRFWPKALVERLQVVAQVFGNALARKRTDQALRASEELSRVTFEQAAVGIAHVGIDGRWLRANSRLCAIVGYAREELIGSTFQEITHPEDLETDLDCVQQMLAGRIENYTMEKRYIRKDGVTVWAILSVSLVRSSAGKPMHFIAVVEDITGRKLAETALRDLSGRLIRAHEEERTRLARELHDDVTQRLARLAIDAGRSERGADEVSPVATMRTIRDGLACLSEDIHALSYRLHPSVLEDLGLAEALRAECERFSRQDSMVIDLSIKDLPGSIAADTALCLFRVTQEALRNVARYARSKRVEVSTRAIDGGLQLAICDDGVGFDPLRQREKPSLGLASMRERVRLLDGNLDIESAPGQGTTVLAWVPLQRGPS